MVALEAAAMAGSGAFITGAVVGWFVLNAMPTVVTLTDQRVVLTLVGGIFALTVAAGTAGYAIARWRHRHSIISKGRVRATGVGLLVALVGAGVSVTTLQPWWFPSAHVLVVPPLVAGEYLALHEVTGGLVFDGKDDVPVLYLQTTRARWIDAAIPQSAVLAVEQAILAAHGLPYTPGQVALGVGGGQQGALRSRAEWLWFVVGVVGAGTVVLAIAQRRQWRNAPWPAPVAADTVRAIARAQDRLDGARPPAP